MFPDVKTLLSSFLLIAVLLCALICYYRKYIAIYSVFPRVHFLSYAVRCVLMSKIPKNIPLHSFFFQFLTESCKQFQKEGLCLFWIFQPYLFIYSEEAFKVFSNENTTVNKPYNFDLFKEFLMNSLLTSGGNLWKKRRTMLNPVFYTPNLRAKVQLINRNAELLVENLQKHNTEASSNILKYLKVCAFRNIYEFLTSLELAADEKNPEVEEAIFCVNQATEMMSCRMLKPWLHPRCFLYFTTKGRRYLQIIENALKLVEKILERMHNSVVHTKVQRGAEINEICRNSRRSFRRIIIEKHVKDQTYTFGDMQGEIAGLLSAGYDTVSYAMMWNLFLLGHHPEIQEQVYEEVESVMVDNNRLSYDDLENLKYLECVIKESLRIYPPVPLYARRTVKDVKCGKYTVPKGTNIVLFTYLAHRDPNLFPDPEKFYPDRFLENNSDKKFITYPFAEGVRNCIGKNFAMMELKIILAHVIKNFKVTSLDRREDISLCWEIILTTAKPLRICLTPRQQKLT